MEAVNTGVPSTQEKYECAATQPLSSSSSSQDGAAILTHSLSLHTLIPEDYGNSFSIQSLRQRTGLLGELFR